MDNTLKVHFLGASGTVTGSKFLIETNEHKILIDCGLFQGLKKLRKMNWDYLPVNANEIDCILLTHGHLDHCGFIPRLVKMGFKGEILGTQPTLKIAEIILKDSAKIQEEEAAKANKYHYSKHDPAEPLYTIKDAEKAIQHFSPIHDDQWYGVREGIKARFRYAGHIIGATFIELDVNGERLVFSGDLGRQNDLLMRAPETPAKADYLFIESTYGNKIHPEIDIEQKLADVIQHTYDKGGNLIIPAFAVERAQLLMFILWRLKMKRKIPSIPMVLDSPMGSNVLKVFGGYSEWHKMSNADCQAMCDSFIIVEDYRETLQLSQDNTSKIIIAGSGMVTGGRVLNYLVELLDDSATSILLVGFQAEGTRGRDLLEGASELKIFGKYFPVKAEVFSDESMSAHGDQKDLLQWTKDIVTPPKKTFIIHGEPHAADALRRKFEDTLNWSTHIPELYEIVDLSK